MHRPVSAGLFLVNAIVSALFLAAPFTIPPQSARHLDGLANVRDHDWSAFPALARVAYGLGDLICHQMDDRSFHANGNEFPVDARLLAMFLAGNLGFLVVRTRADGQSGALVFAEMVPIWAMRRRWFMPMLLAASLFPTALDGFVQLWTPYTSTNLLRAVTGAWMGVGGAMWLALAFDALAAPELPTARERDANA